VGCLDRASAGDVRIDGQSLVSLSDDDRTKLRRDKIGYICQFNLLPTLNCLENVGLPLHLTDKVSLVCYAFDLLQL
jgi:putative ABC transport system ATP-binding protein